MYQKRNSDYKIRLLAIERILDNTPKNATQIIRELEKEYAIECDRKVVYDDIAALTMFYPNLYVLKPPYRGYILVDDMEQWKDKIDERF